MPKFNIFLPLSGHYAPHLGPLATRKQALHTILCRLPVYPILTVRVGNLRARPSVGTVLKNAATDPVETRDVPPNLVKTVSGRRRPGMGDANGGKTLTDRADSRFV